MKLHVFSDESGHGTERYRALGFVCVPDHKVDSVRGSLRALLSRHNVSEIAWKEIDGDSRKQKCGTDFIEECIRHACAGDLTATVLIWDLHDQRHAIARRDDIANRERMFHHGVVNSARRRAARTLCLYPDRTSEMIDYHGIKSYLTATSAQAQRPELISLFQSGPARFDIEALQELNSEDEPLIQLADLLCGMGRAPREWTAELKAWRRTRSAPQAQAKLFDSASESEVQRVSRGKEAKFSLIEAFKSHCDSRKLGISLSEGYLRTFSPKYPINFWLYRPQHGRDKAPTKAIRSAIVP